MDCRSHSAPEMEFSVEHKHELHGRVISRKHLLRADNRIHQQMFGKEHLESDGLWRQILLNHEVLIEVLGQ